MDLRQFQAHARQHGFSLNNRFIATIPIPIKVSNRINNSEPQESDFESFIKKGARIVNILAGGTSTSQRGLQIMCSAADIPGLNIERSPNKRNGFNVNVATGISEEDVSFRFLLSSDCYEKKLLDIWREEIVDTKTRRAGYYLDYITDIMIQTLDTSNRRQFTVKLVEAWPSLFNKISLDKQQNTNFNTYDINFTYKRQESVTESGSSNPFAELTPTKLVEDLMNGDLEAAAYKARDLKVAAANGSISTKLGGEVYSSLSSVVNQTVGISASDVENIIGGFKSSSVSTMPDNNPDKNVLSNLCDSLLK